MTNNTTNLPLEEKLKTFPKTFVEIIVLWIQENLQFIEQLSIIDVWKKHIQIKDHMYIR